MVTTFEIKLSQYGKCRSCLLLVFADQCFYIKWLSYSFSAPSEISDAESIVQSISNYQGVGDDQRKLFWSASTNTQSFVLRNEQ